MFRLLFLPVRLALKVLRLSLRMTGRSNALLLGIGILIGLLIAPTTGAELRARLQERLAERRNAGPDGGLVGSTDPSRNF